MYFYLEKIAIIWDAGNLFIFCLGMTMTIWHETVYAHTVSSYRDLSNLCVGCRVSFGAVNMDEDKMSIIINILYELQVHTKNKKTVI